MSTQMLRYMVLYFVNTGTAESEVWSLCGKGFTKLDESPNPQTESKTYIHEKTASPSIKSYEPSFPFEAELWRGEESIKKIYEVGRQRKVGSEAVIDFVATDFTVDESGATVGTPTARRMNMAVEISDLITGEGGEVLTMSGNLNQVGEAVEGTFDLTTKKFTETSEA